MPKQTTLPLSILAEAGRLDVVPDGAPVAYESGPGWIGWEPDLVESDGSVRDHYEIDPNTAMGRAAIACIIAGLRWGSDATVSSMVTAGGVEGKSGLWVTLADAEDSCVWGGARIPILASLAMSPEGIALALVAVVMHLVKP